MNAKTFNELIEKKQETLKKIENSKYPINPQKKDRHEERVWNASQYCDELNGLYFTTDKEIYIVAKETFEKRVATADYASIESDGQFHTLAYIGNYPSDCYLVWMERLSNI